MIPDFDANGNLPPGDLIRPTIQEFEERFANTSILDVRKKIFDGYKNYCEYLISLGVASIQWIDGSYTTKKSAPNDIDLVIHFNGMQLHNDIVLRKQFKTLVDPNQMKPLYMCHPQFVLVYPNTNPDLYSYYLDRYKYWLKWFSKDREGNAKGLIEFDLEKIDYKSEIRENGDELHAQGN